MATTNWVLKFNNRFFHVFIDHKCHTNIQTRNVCNIVSFNDLEYAKSFKNEVLYPFKIQEVKKVDFNTNHIRENKIPVDLDVEIIRTHVANSVLQKSDFYAGDTYLQNTKRLNFLQIDSHKFVSNDGYKLDHEDVMKESQFLYNKSYILSVQGIIHVNSCEWVNDMI